MATSQKALGPRGRKLWTSVNLWCEPFVMVVFELVCVFELLTDSQMTKPRKHKMSHDKKSERQNVDMTKSLMTKKLNITEKGLNGKGLQAFHSL